MSADDETSDLRDVFARHEPPPGGLTALRARIRREERRRSLSFGLGGLALAGATAAVLLLARSPEAPGWYPDDPSLVALGLVRPPAEPVQPLDGRDTAVQRVETNTPGVTYYRVYAPGT